MKMLSIHEAVPGHYVQQRYNNDTPSLVRRIFGNGAYIEGWAVYTEGMMLDSGYGDNDPRLRLFQLKWRLREQSNLLIDAGFHAEGMTKAQIEDLLVRQAFQEEAQFETKWHRLQLSHDQLSSYYVGLDAITRTRDAIRSRLGPNYDLAAFNLGLLKLGSVEPRFIAPLLDTAVRHKVSLRYARVLHQLPRADEDAVVVRIEVLTRPKRHAAEGHRHVRVACAGLRTFHRVRPECFDAEVERRERFDVAYGAVEDQTAPTVVAREPRKHVADERRSQRGSTVDDEDGAVPRRLQGRSHEGIVFVNVERANRAGEIRARAELP